MKLSKYSEACYEFTGKASEITRQLILAGIAIIWIFRIQENYSDKITINLWLLAALIGLCLAALSDLLQYVIGGKIWGSFFKNEEKKAKLAGTVKDDPDVKAPKRKSFWIEFFYNIKIALMVISYVLIIIFLIGHIHIS